MDSDGTIASRRSPQKDCLLQGFSASELQRRHEAAKSFEEDEKASPVLRASTDDESRYGQREDTVGRETDIARQEGDASVYKYYAGAAGLRSVILFLSALLVSACIDAFSRMWVVWWAEANEDDPDISHGKWIGVYSVLGFVGVMANLLASWELFITVVTKTGLYFHSLLIQAVSRAPMSFFQTVDLGVTVNRFSQDMQLIDMELPASALGAATALATVISQAVLIGVTGRYIAAAFPFLLLIFYLIQKVYLRTSRQLRFLDIEHRAPLYSHTMEILDGLASIRAFGFDSSCMEAICNSLDESQRPAYFLGCLQQWLLFASDMIIAVLAVILITITTTLRQEIGVSFMGLALSNVVGFGSTIQMLLVTWVQLEISMGAIARVKNFNASIDTENINEPSTCHRGEPGWPSRGKVSFRNVSVSYP